MSKSVNVDFVTRQIEVDTDGKEHFISAAMAAKDAEASMLNAQNAAKEVKEIYGDGNFTPLSDLLGSLGTKLKRWGAIFANKVFASNLPIVYNSVAEMKADTLLWEGMNTKTLGYYAPNDGGSASYLIRAKLESDTDDGGSLHELANGLVAELIVENGTVNVKQFGAVGDGINDDTTPVQKAINPKWTTLIPSGSYKITNTITSTVYCHLKAIGAVELLTYVDGIAINLLGDDTTQGIYAYQNVSVPFFDGSTGCFIFINMLDARKAGTIGCQIGKSSDTTLHNGFLKLDNVKFYRYEKGLVILPIHAYLMTFQRIHIEQCINAVQTGDTALTNYDSGENIKWIDCIFSNCDVAFDLQAGWELNFTMCGFDFLKTVFKDSLDGYHKINVSHSHIEGIGISGDDTTGILVGKFIHSIISLNNIDIDQSSTSKTFRLFNVIGYYFYITMSDVYFSSGIARTLSNDYFMGNIPLHLNGAFVRQDGLAPMTSPCNNIVFNGDLKLLTDDNTLKGFTKGYCANAGNITLVDNPITGSKGIRFTATADGVNVWTLESDFIDVEAGREYHGNIALRSNSANPVGRSLKVKYYHNDELLSTSDSYINLNESQLNDMVDFPFGGKDFFVPINCNRIKLSFIVSSDNGIGSGNHLDFLYFFCEKLS